MCSQRFKWNEKNRLRNKRIGLSSAYVSTYVRTLNNWSIQGWLWHKIILIAFFSSHIDFARKKKLCHTQLANYLVPRSIVFANVLRHFSISDARNSNVFFMFSNEIKICFLFFILSSQVQFFLIMTHWMFLLFHDDCGFPLFPVAIMVPQNLFMLALFADFYYKTYIKKRKSLSDVKTTDVQAPDDTIQQTINNKVTINGNSRHRIIDKKYVNGNANGNIVS